MLWCLKDTRCPLVIVGDAGKDSCPKKSKAESGSRLDIKSRQQGVASRSSRGGFVVLWSIDWPCTKKCSPETSISLHWSLPKADLERVLLSGIVPMRSWLVHWLVYKLLQRDTLELVDMKKQPCKGKPKNSCFTAGRLLDLLFERYAFSDLTWHATLIVGEAWQEDETLLPMEANEVRSFQNSRICED